MGRKFEVRKEAMMKTSLQKAKLYSRFGKEIYMCAKEGGANPDANLSLKHLIERAKKQQVPMDIINRNIEKASGQSDLEYILIRYEGFGPGGSAFIIDALTDNVNRTVSEVRNCFTKIGAKLGVKGSVEHMYAHQSIVELSGIDAETLLEHLLEHEIDVIDIEEHQTSIVITGTGYDLDKIEHAAHKLETIEIVHSEQGWYPHETITLYNDDRDKFDKFMRLIDEVEDVQNVYHNVND